MTKADALKQAINHHFWSDNLCRYSYLVDEFGGCDRQEALGHAFALLFGVVPEDLRETLVRSLHAEPAGTPCLWPSYDRYANGDNVGRHSGTIWPPIQAFWAEAAIRSGHPEVRDRELNQIASNAVRDGHFHELFHPRTALPYGGLQERHNLGITQWQSMPHQTWSATAYLRLILFTVCGLRFGSTGLRVEPELPANVNHVRLSNLRYRDCTITLDVERANGAKQQIAINGKTVDSDFIIKTDTSGEVRIDVTVSERS